MLYHTLYTVALLLLAVLLILAIRKITRLKDQNFTLYVENCDLKGYNRALSHINRTNLDTINRLNIQIKNLKKH